MTASLASLTPTPTTTFTSRNCNAHYTRPQHHQFCKIGARIHASREKGDWKKKKEKFSVTKATARPTSHRRPSHLFDSVSAARLAPSEQIPINHRRHGHCRPCAHTSGPNRTGSIFRPKNRSHTTQPGIYLPRSRHRWHGRGGQSAKKKSRDEENSSRRLDFGVARPCCAPPSRQFPCQRWA